MPTEVAPVKSGDKGDDVRAGMTRNRRGTSRDWKWSAPRAGPQILAAAVVAALVGSPGGAGATSFDLDFFKPTTAKNGYFHQENASTLGHGALATELASTYLFRPLVLRNQRDGSLGGDVVRDRVTTYLTAAYGLTPRLDIGVRFAMVARQIGLVAVNFSDGGIPVRASLYGRGDTDLLVRFNLMAVERPGHAFRLTLTAPFSLPTGQEEAFATDGRVAFKPSVTAGWQTDAHTIAASVGFAWRARSEVPASSLVVGNMVLAGMGGSVRVLPHLWVLMEVSAAVGTQVSHTAAGSAVTQALAGVRGWGPGDIVLQAGIGSGLNGNAGSPRFSAVASAGRTW